MELREALAVKTEPATCRRGTRECGPHRDRPEESSQVRGESAEKDLAIEPMSDSKKPLTCIFLVGDTRIELVTSSVSRKRSPTELIAR
jgi:hypothetical protein